LGAGHELLEYEGSGLGSSTSNSDTHAPENKDGVEPNSQQVGPLLGSCVSAPFSPSIVSRDNSFRLNLTDEMVGDVTSQREVEPDTFASVEHEMLLVHSAFSSPNSFGGESLAHLNLFVVFRIFQIRETSVFCEIRFFWILSDNIIKRIFSMIHRKFFL